MKTLPSPPDGGAARGGNGEGGCRAGRWHERGRVVGYNLHCAGPVADRDAHFLCDEPSDWCGMATPWPVFQHKGSVDHLEALLQDSGMIAMMRETEFPTTPLASTKNARGFGTVYTASCWPHGLRSLEWLAAESSSVLTLSTRARGSSPFTLTGSRSLDARSCLPLSGTK